MYKRDVGTLIPILAGPYGPYANALKRTYETIDRSLNLKTEEGRDKAKKQFSGNLKDFVSAMDKFGNNQEADTPGLLNAIENLLS